VVSVAKCRENRKILKIRLPKPRPSTERRTRAPKVDLISSLSKEDAIRLLNMFNEALGGQL